VIGYLIEIALIWWILSSVFKWMAKQSSPQNNGNNPPPQNAPEETATTTVHSGRIEDADFEELDDR
jgi:hypothetical protein